MDTIWTALIITGKLTVLILIGWLIYRYILWRDKRDNQLIESMTEKAADSIITYDSTGRKQKRRDLYECMKRGRAG